MKELAAFICTALLSALQLSVSSCSNPGECGDGAPQPEFPVQQPPLLIVKPIRLSGAGDLDPLPFDLSSATVEIAGKQVVIRYAVQGDAREVVYDIVAHE